jgi:hypothetical protein
MKRIAATLALGLAALTAQADGFNAGIQFEDKVSLADIGLPAYPGAVQVKEEGRDGKDDDKGAFGLSLWGGSFGMKLSLLKYRSDDSMERIGQFYREAMGRYGKVLDCSVTAPSDEDKSEGRKSKTVSLRCSKDDVQPGKLVIKVGKDDKHFRMVAMERQAKGVEFQLLNLAINGD